VQSLIPSRATDIATTSGFRTPPLKDIKEAVKRSGYLFEQRIVPMLEKQGYKATPNHVFVDPETGEAREIDVFAISGERIMPRSLDFIFPILLIECKNLVAPLVFFTQNEIPISELAGDVQVAGIPLEIERKDEKISLSDFLGIEKFHHYYQTRRLSTQFCCVFEKEKGGKKRWIAAHDLEGMGNLYQRLVIPLLKGVEAQRRELMESYYRDPERERINLEFYFPIILTAGPLFECFVGRSRPKYRRVHQIAFIRRHKSKLLSGDCRIDVVEQTGFRRLLGTIDKDVRELARRIKSKRKILYANMFRIAKEKLEQDRRLQGSSHPKQPHHSAPLPESMIVR
jgi:hypothetical protein